MWFGLDQLNYKLSHELSHITLLLNKNTIMWPMTSNGAKDLFVSQIAVGEDVGLSSERCNLTKKTNRKGKSKIRNQKVIANL